MTEQQLRLRSLRVALAVTRGMALLQQLRRENVEKVLRGTEEREGFLFALLTRIHREMFCDWQQQGTAKTRPGQLFDAKARIAVREALERAVVGEPCDRLFNDSGYVIRHDPSDRHPMPLAKLYDMLRNIRMFEYGNQMTLDFFMVALGTLPAFDAVYPSGIDFRRLTTEEIAVLHDRTSGVVELEKVLLSALDAANTPALSNRESGHNRGWPRNVINVGGVPFLSYTIEEGPTCLVTVNGGLVPLATVQHELEKHFLDDGLIADFPPVRTDQLADPPYVPGTEHLREPGKTVIDGFLVSADAAPLCCLDVNILTGLRMDGHGAVGRFIKERRGPGGSLFDLANNPQIFNDLLNEVPQHDVRLRRMIEIAADHLGRIVVQMDAAKERVFSGKEPVDDSSLVVSMGGSGTGKTLVARIAKTCCDDNLVVASLDDFREFSDLYSLLLAAKHHDDDYMIVEGFANALRDWVLIAAREEGYHALYDGSGIVYEGRYAKAVRGFKARNFFTEVILVDAPLVTAIDRVDERFREKGRTLPWPVVTVKHVQLPQSLLSALTDRNLDKLSLFATDGEPADDYVFAEKFVLMDEEVRALNEMQRAGGLAAHLRTMIETRPDSVLRRMAGLDGAAHLANRIPGFHDANVGFLVYPIGDGINTVLAIYNTGRFIQLLKKAQLNPHASDKEGLRLPPRELTFLTRRGGGAARRAVAR